MPAIIERPKMTRVMYQSLKRHIMKDREKKKQAEQDQEQAMERVRKEREMRKKKEQEDSLTLEQTKEQVSELNKKLEKLKEDKHELFSSLKKVLHQEDETRRRAALREQGEMLSVGQAYAPGMAVTTHPMFLQSGQTMGRPQLYKPPQPHPMLAAQQPLKRARSPSPTPVSIFQAYPHDPKYPATSFAQSKMQQSYTVQPKHSAYQGQSSSPYASQASHSYQTPSTYATSQATNKFLNQSAFSSYPSHYAAAQHQQSKISAEQYQQNFAMAHRVQQQGYLAMQHGAMPIQQIESSSQKTSSYEDKYKIHQQAMRPVAAIPPQQQSLIPPSQVPIAAQPQNTGSIVTGYPVRTQSTSHSNNVYQTSQAAYTSQQNGIQRHPYHGVGQQGNRYNHY